MKEAAKKSLTSEMKIDNLRKFAKTSLVAKVILDRPSQESEVKGAAVRKLNEESDKQQIQTTTAHQVRGHKSGFCRFRP
jgi:hypothetical protein